MLNPYQKLQSIYAGQKKSHQVSQTNLQKKISPSINQLRIKTDAILIDLPREEIQNQNSTRNLKFANFRQKSLKDVSFLYNYTLVKLAVSQRTKEKITSEVIYQKMQQKLLQKRKIESLRSDSTNLVDYERISQQNLTTKDENKLNFVNKPQQFPALPKSLPKYQMTQIKIEKQEEQKQTLPLDQFISQVKSTIKQESFASTPLNQKLMPKKIINASILFKLSSFQIEYYITLMQEAFKQPQVNDTIFQLYREHILQTYTSLTFSNTLKSIPQSVIDSKMIQFQRKPNLKYQKTIVFDLDETLIHCNENSNLPSDLKINVTFPTGDIVQAGINIRPYAIQILTELCKLCEVLIFTASHSCYASRNTILSGCLFRDRCVVSDEGVHIKDLRVLGRDLKDIVLVDNAAYSFSYQISNGIPIIPFYDCKEDQELKLLESFLINQILPANDVRKVIKDYFQIHRYIEFTSSVQAVQVLYK